MTHNAWRFVPGDLRLAHGDGRRINPPCTHTVKGPPELCKVGFHGSLTLRDALATGYQHVHEPCLTSSRIGGVVVVGDDKLCGTTLHTDWVATREETERFFRLWAVRCARAVLHLAREADRHTLERTLDVAERYAWGSATDEELAAARDASRDAGDASRAAARDAAWAASRAAGAASRDALAAARDAAWAAWDAWDAQEVMANELFVELFGDEHDL